MLRSRRFLDRLNRTAETPNFWPPELANHRQKHKNNNRVLIPTQISKFLYQVRSFRVRIRLRLRLRLRRRLRIRIRLRLRLRFRLRLRVRVRVSTRFTPGLNFCRDPCRDPYRDP